MEKYDIFLSYRRCGGWETAKLLYEFMKRDGYSISFDTDNLREGRFDTELLRRIDQCTDFIVILDEHVFDKTLDKSCKREDDWLRRELAHALEKGKNIIPAMLEGFRGFPDNLPDDIKVVNMYNSLKLDKYCFDDLYNKLISNFIKSKPHKPKDHYGLLKIITDTDCNVLVDFEDKGIAYTNQIKRIPLSQDAVHNLRFESRKKNNICQEETNYQIKSGFEQTYKVELDRLDKMSTNEIYSKGQKYYYGEGVTLNEEKAVQLYKMAAEGGYDKAMNSLGYCYDKGTGIARNFNEAVYWYKEAASRGNIKAMWNLGDCYQKSEIKDYEQAEYWYREAAKKGHAKSMNAIGDLYYFGEGVTQNFIKAVEWYKQSAETGDAYSIDRLMYCYKYGCGVDKNLLIANKLEEAFDSAITGENERAIGMVNGALK